MPLSQYTEPSLLVPRLLSEYRDSAIAELSNRLEQAERIENARAFTHAVLDHETLVSAVFEEVAFPLARGQAVKELSFALGLSPQGIRWGLGKAPTVHAVVLFAVPLSAEQPYLSLVVTFSKFLQDESAFSALRQCAQPEEMLAALKEVRLRRTGPKLAAAQP
jgi:mannitol/fructose-specific phosphotransferase system IIA component (Ntr-type)